MVITMIDTQYKIKSKKFDIFPLINSVIMILFVIITLYPVLNTLAISLNDGTDALRGGIYLWPRKFTWKNYTTVLHKETISVPKGSFPVLGHHHVCKRWTDPNIPLI